jgi:hypothetical protein
MRDDLNRARIVITNYHAFQRREILATPKLAKEVLGAGQFNALYCQWPGAVRFVKRHLHEGPL